MSQTGSTASTIFSCLERENAAVGRFVAILQREQDALSSGDADRLPALSAEKSVLVEELIDLAETRNSQLQREGFAADRNGLSAWANAAGPMAVRARDHLLELAARARELNRLNGELIAMRLTHTQAALAALALNGREANVYGRDGHASPNTGYRIIDLA